MFAYFPNASRSIFMSEKHFLDAHAANISREGEFLAAKSLSAIIRRRDEGKLSDASLKILQCCNAMLNNATRW